MSLSIKGSFHMLVSREAGLFVPGLLLRSFSHLTSSPNFLRLQNIVVPLENLVAYHVSEGLWFWRYFILKLFNFESLWFWRSLILKVLECLGTNNPAWSCKGVVAYPTTIAKATHTELKVHFSSCLFLHSLHQSSKVSILEQQHPWENDYSTPSI